MRIIGGPANQTLGHIEFQIALFTIPIDDFANFGHDFGANAVARKDKK